MIRKQYYATGSVRGCCGHDHKTLEAAAKCVEADRRGCKKQGGYSDRHIVESDGWVKTVYVQDADDTWVQEEE